MRFINRLCRRLGARDEGQAMVEFALLFPLVIIVLFAGVFFGFYFQDKSIALDAARQAARTYAVGGGPSEAQGVAYQTLKNAGIAAPAPDVTVSQPIIPGDGTVTYTVSYTDPVLPFAFGLLPVLQNLQTVTERSTFYVEQ